MQKDNEHYDVILVGSGTCSAVIAKELSKHGRSVLILEQGKDIQLKESFLSTLSIVKEFSVGERLKATCATTVGGSTGLYFGVCKMPTPSVFDKFGIDLSSELEEVVQELPLASLPDEFLSPQTLKFMHSAKELGYPMQKNQMLIDLAECDSPYDPNAKWKAKSYIVDAINEGATLITQATVQHVLVKNNQAVGVEFIDRRGRLGSKRVKVYGEKVILSAGAFSTPKLLMDCGIKNVGRDGFFCKPSFMMFGVVPELKGRDTFLGGVSMDLDIGVSLGDSTMTSMLFNMVMLANFKLRYLFAHSKVVSAGMILYDTPGGELRDDGSYHKTLSEQESKKLDESAVVATRVLKNAGAKDVIRLNPIAGIPGGVIKVGEHVDENLQTEVKNLYVCDHSLMSDTKSTPTIFLVCLGKHLAKCLLDKPVKKAKASLQPTQLA